MKLLLLVNGNAKQILNAHKMKLSDFEVFKVDFKKLAKAKEIIKFLRKTNEAVYFGCIDIDYQRFIPIMIMYILFSKSKHGGIIDEMGRTIDFSILKAIVIYPFELFIEIIASFFIILFSYFYFYIWWWKVKKN